ncbi:MAG: AraC family transcriptional regulator [Glaciecola sp.]|jgi:AraC-like DNA-binding protein
MHIHLWPYKAIYVGPSPDNDVHAHHAVQICIGVDKKISLQNDVTQSFVEGRCIAILEDVPHKVLAQNTRIVAMYLEPEDKQNQLFLDAISQTVGDGIGAISLSDKQLGSIAQHLLADVNIDDVWETISTAMGLTNNPASSTRKEDKRVRAVIDIIASRRGRAVDLKFLSSKVYLSPSRLTHLFKQEVGIPINRFIVWWRIRKAIEELSKSATLTEAAHASGFSDLPHMSKTFRQLFGFAPSSLFKPHTIKCHGN